MTTPLDLNAIEQRHGKVMEQQLFRVPACLTIIAQESVEVSLADIPQLCQEVRELREKLSAMVAGDPYRRCAAYVMELHLKNRPDTGAIDALKTAYEQFHKWAKEIER